MQRHPSHRRRIHVKRTLTSGHPPRSASPHPWHACGDVHKSETRKPMEIASRAQSMGLRKSCIGSTKRIFRNALYASIPSSYAIPPEQSSGHWLEQLRRSNHIHQKSGGSLIAYPVQWTRWGLPNGPGSYLYCSNVEQSHRAAFTAPPCLRSESIRLPINTSAPCYRSRANRLPNCFNSSAAACATRPASLSPSAAPATASTASRLW